MKEKQLSLFNDPKEDRRAVAHEKATRTQHEKKLMNDVIEAATKIGLPCIHIQYYCGNKFYPKCKCGGMVICSKCGKPVLVECHNLLNKELSGLPDVLGIAWAIETKHKINKVKKQKLKLAQNQDKMFNAIRGIGIPALIINEDNADEAFKFLMQMKEKLS